MIKRGTWRHRPTGTYRLTRLGFLNWHFAIRSRHYKEPLTTDGAHDGGLAPFAWLARLRAIAQLDEWDRKAKTSLAIGVDPGFSLGGKVVEAHRGDDGMLYIDKIDDVTVVPRLYSPPAVELFDDPVPSGTTRPPKGS